MSEKHIVRIEGLQKSYTLGKARQTVLREVNLSIRTGEFVAIMGASGSGKSTLLHILGLLDHPDSGRVFFQQQEVFGLPSRQQNILRNRAFGFVFQFYHLLPELNVLENVLLPLMVGTSTLKWCLQKRALRRQAMELIDSIGLTKQLTQRPATLSGGERQRAALARALVGRPALLLADEPTGNLDSVSGKIILDILTRLNREGQTIIMVTHDTAVAERAHRRLVLRDGVLG